MNQKNNFVQSFRYPWIDIVHVNGLPVFLFLLVRYHVNSYLGMLDALLVLNWLFLVYIFGIQYSYIKLSVYLEQIKVSFPLSLYLKEKTYPFSDISAIILFIVWEQNLTLF